MTQSCGRRLSWRQPFSPWKELKVKDWDRNRERELKLPALAVVFVVFLKAPVAGNRVHRLRGRAAVRLVAVAHAITSIQDMTCAAIGTALLACVTPAFE